jgi:hypothetical protein
VIGDVLGEPGRKVARSAANISPEARETMNIALNARGEAQGQRGISGSTIGSGSNARAAAGARRHPAHRQQCGLWGGRAGKAPAACGGLISSNWPAVRQLPMPCEGRS